MIERQTAGSRDKRDRVEWRRTASRLARVVMVAAICALPAYIVPTAGRASVSLPAAQCPRGVSVADGCVAAPASGSFQILTSFSSQAAQSGQTWVNSHPWPWNAAGVDYPVGYSMSVPLGDPATAVLPAGCAYQATGGIGGAPRVFCDRLPSHIGVINPTIQGLDFSLHGCVVLEFSQNVIGTVTVQNNNFKSGPNCAVTSGYLIKLDGGSANLVLKYNQIDGNAQQYPAALAGTIQDNSPTGSLTMEYNAIINSPQRPVNSYTSGNIVDRYNYIDGWVLYNPVLEHGETLLDQPGPRISVASVIHAFNTVLLPAAEIANSTTAPFFLSGTPGGYNFFASSTVDHNVVVTNLADGVPGQYTTSAALAYIDWGLFGTVTVTNNYVDPTGAIFCTLNVGGASSIIGRISGRTLTVTSVGIGAIYAGAIFQTVVNVQATAVIQPYGTIDPNTGSPSTGTGGVGTYVLSGAAQSVSFTAGKTQTSPVAHLITSGNVSLVTGTPILGVGALNGATCPPNY